MTLIITCYKIPVSDCGEPTEVEADVENGDVYITQPGDDGATTYTQEEADALLRVLHLSCGRGGLDS